MISFTLNRAAGENVGKYTITPVGTAVQGNYNVAYATDMLEITRATATVTAENQEKVYGTADQELTWTVDGLTNGDTKSVISATVSRKEGENVGTYTIMPAGDAVQNNYNVVFKTGEMTITKAAAKVTAGNKSKTYDGLVYNDSDLTAAVTGLVGNDTISYNLTAEGATDAGTYTIKASGSSDQGNYNVEFADGTLTIDKRKVTLTSGSDEKQYDGSS